MGLALYLSRVRSNEVLGRKLHRALTHTVGWWPIAELYSCTLHEAARFKHRTNSSEKFVGVRAIHVKGSIASIHRHFVSVVLPHPGSVNGRLQLRLQSK